MSHTLRLTVQEITPNSVIVKNIDNQIWEIPKETVHGTVTVGEELRFMGQTPSAQGLLNELLGKAQT